MEKATSLEEFRLLLLQEDIEVRESRGRLRYLTPDRMKSITAGGWATTMRKPLCWTSWHKTPNGSQNGAWEIDMAAKRAEGKGVGYERWAKVHNLKQAAKAWNI